MKYFITGTCSIRNKSLMANDRLEHYEENFVNFADFIKSLYKQEGVSYPKFFKMDGLSKLGFLTAEALLKRNDLSGYSRERIGLILSNSASSLDTDLAYYETIRDRENYFPSPALFVYTLPNIMNGEICIRNGFKGENTFFVSEAFDPELLADQVREAFEQERMDACITGWVELLRDRYESILFLIEKETALDPEKRKEVPECSHETLMRLYCKSE